MLGMELLNNYKQQIKLLGESNGISNIRIFGSVIRSEERPDSDIDLLVEVDKNRTLFDLIRFKYSVEDLLGCEVNVISDRAVHHSLKTEIIEKAISLEDIILPIGKSTQGLANTQRNFAARGSLSIYANKQLRSDESKAWHKAVEDQ
jgi:predicted nucleotidyltransferase